jgi:hypothetical protein
VHARGDRDERAYRRVERLLFLAELLGTLLIAPDFRIGKQLLDYVQALFLAFEVKDTSEVQPIWSPVRSEQR